MPGAKVTNTLRLGAATRTVLNQRQQSHCFPLTQPKPAIQKGGRAVGRHWLREAADSESAAVSAPRAKIIHQQFKISDLDDNAVVTEARKSPTGETTKLRSRPRSGGTTT